MLLLIKYVFSMIFMHAVAEFLESNPGAPEADGLRQHWGTVGGSMVSLFKAISGGDDWQNIGDPLKATGEVYYLVFLLFVLFLFFAVLNILTGVFIHKADTCLERDVVSTVHE